MLQGLKKRWEVAEPHPAAESLAQELGVHRLIGQVLTQRQITDSKSARSFLQPSLHDLSDPKEMPGTEKAAQRIVQAVRDNESIILYGDYDVDGVAALAILYHILKKTNPDLNVLRYIPHRIQEGYGLNTEAIVRFSDNGAKLIVTVDCGISALEPAAEARARGMDLIVTDHHEMGEGLPDAFAIVHPHLSRSDDGSVLSEPCGATVAYKLAWQIAREWCGSEKVLPEYRETLLNLLSLSAMGTVADVVPLVGENRIIVQFGLARIKRTPIEGLNALIDASRLRDETVDAYRVGFILGPRLNACGRMGHAKKACLLLTTATGAEAKEIAEFLNKENEKRRIEEEHILNHAKRRVKDMGYDQDDVRIIVLSDDHWHPGVLGIVCSRLVESYGRPAILVNVREDLGKGSARSIDGFNIYEALSACSDPLVSYGGHAMAAGIQIMRDRIDEFRDAMIAYAQEHISVEQLTPTVFLDGEAMLNELTVDVVGQMDRLAPFGRSNPGPCFLLRDVTITHGPEPLGKTEKHMSMRVKQGSWNARCLGWRMADLIPQLSMDQRIDLACRPKINTWKGDSKVELEIEDVRVTGEGM